MELILDIFEKLSIDKTFFVQFALTVTFYFILKTLLFGKLQFVLEMRDSKTTKMEDNANVKFDKAEKLSKQVDDEVNATYEQAQAEYNNKKNQIIARGKAEIKELEAKLSQTAEVEKQKIQEEVRAHREAILSKADELSTGLLNKIVQ